MSLLTHPLAWWVRETSPPYGAPPETSPGELALELVEAWHVLARAESSVALAEGDTLRLVADQRLHVRLGFSSFHDFCVEAAEMTASTGKRRVAVSRLAADVPALRDALLDGAVSQCQALALRPVVTAESVAWWIAVAARSTVTELRAAVRQAVAAEKAGSAESSIDDASSTVTADAEASDSAAPGSAGAEATDSATPESGESGSATSDAGDQAPGAPFGKSGSAASGSASDPYEEEPDGRRVSIAAPIAARLAFEEGLEQARKTLGYDAPRHACIAAMLAEVAGDGLTSDPHHGNESELGINAGGGRAGLDGKPGRRSDRDNESSGEDPAEIDSEPADPLQRRFQRLCRSQHQARPFATSHDSAFSARVGDRSTRVGDRSTRVEDRSIRAEDRSTRARDRSTDEPTIGTRSAASANDDAASARSDFQSTSRSAAESADTRMGTVSVGACAPALFATKAVPAHLRDSMNRARRTLDQVYEQLDSFRELLESAPTEADVDDPASLVERLEEIRAVSAPIHVLSLRVLLHLEDVSAARYLGVRTQDALAETHLRLSPRTFRQLMAEAWQMKRRPELETAYLSGNIGVSRLRLLGSIESRRLEKFLPRARRVTLRQLKRELRFHEKLVVLRDQLQRERSAQERCAEGHAERHAERHEGVARGVRPGTDHNCKDRPPLLVLSERDCDPLPGNDLDAKLACILLQHGHLGQELEKNLTRPALCTAEEAASLIAKAKALVSHSIRGTGQRRPNRDDDLEQSGQRARDEAGRRVRSDPDARASHGTGCACSDADARASHGAGCACSDADARASHGAGCACSDADARASHRAGRVCSDADARASHGAGCACGAACDHAAAGEFEIYQRDPAANPAVMRLLETLVDLALLSVCDDSLLVGSQVYPRGRQSLSLEGDFCRISFWAPDPVIEDLNHFLDNIRQRVGPLPAWAALMILIREAVDTWKKVDKTKKPQFWRIFERDDYLCRVPACSKRADLHGHHIIFRSQGGSDDPENIATGCYGHHQHGVHEGHLHCCGNANKALRWVLGPKAKRAGPFRVYYGDLRVQ